MSTDLMQCSYQAEDQILLYSSEAENKRTRAKSCWGDSVHIDTNRHLNFYIAQPCGQNHQASEYLGFNKLHLQRWL